MGTSEYINQYLLNRSTNRIDEADRRRDILLIVNQIADRLKGSSTMTDILKWSNLLGLLVSAEQSDDTVLYACILKVLEQ